MGWQRGRITLKWSDQHELHGLVITMKRRPLGALVDEWMGQGDEERKDWDLLTPKERADRAMQNAEDLAKLIIEWNYEDDEGAPVAATLDGILRHVDDAMISYLWESYSVASSRLAPPLPQSSEPGPQAPEPPAEWDLGSAQETAAVGSD